MGNLGRLDVALGVHPLHDHGLPRHTFHSCCFRQAELTRSLCLSLYNDPQSFYCSGKGQWGLGNTEDEMLPCSTPQKRNAFCSESIS